MNISSKSIVLYPAAHRNPLRTRSYRCNLCIVGPPSNKVHSFVVLILQSAIEFYVRLAFKSFQVVTARFARYDNIIRHVECYIHKITSAVVSFRILNAFSAVGVVCKAVFVVRRRIIIIIIIVPPGIRA